MLRPQDGFRIYLYAQSFDDGLYNPLPHLAEDVVELDLCVFLVALLPLTCLYAPNIQ